VREIIQFAGNRRNHDDEEAFMAKAGMRRPDPEEPHGTESNHKLHIPKNDQKPVPEIQGKAKYGHKKADDDRE
jgi:hypothetical protein